MISIHREVTGRLFAVFLAGIGAAAATGAAELSGLDACLLNQLQSAGESTTVEEIRRICEAETEQAAQQIVETEIQEIPVYEQQSAIDERFLAESVVEERPFAITPQKPNYLLFTAMDKANQPPFEEATGVEEPLDDEEMQFQVSIKAPIWRQMFGSDIDTYFAYTARSYWQLFNDDVSSPFRETNYEPEIYLRGITDYELFGANFFSWTLGFNHQSNGRGGSLSRSWNRILGQAGISAGDDLSFLLRTWYRIPEDDEDDDNPGMHRYFGYGDIRAIWTPNRNTFTAMLRPGTRETSFELTWSYPISKVFRIYAQYYNGYGESLVDYDYEMERVGIGIALNDYLQRY